MDSPVWVYLLGLSGMGIYGARILIQWYMSEKSQRVESPGIYWVLSSVGAVILYIYGWLRKDFSILFGESLGYYIYMWNISVHGLYKKVPRAVVVLQALFPVMILALIIKDFPTFKDSFLHNADVPMKLLLFGVAGQFVYEMRSVYQLVYSYRHKGSFLPFGHWMIAVVGSAMIIMYGIIRHDWVLAIGQFSIFFSLRNLMIASSSMRREKKKVVSTRKAPVTLLMIRPSHFDFNEQTAPSNHFQHRESGIDVQRYAREEFDEMVEMLRHNLIPILVLDDPADSETPDSIYPNNWFSTHSDGSLVLYPMCSPNRRAERRPAVIQEIKKQAGTTRVVDLTGWEEKGEYLESTGSMVFDRKSRTAYACRSPRTSEKVLDDFCRQMGYQAVVFDASDRNGHPIYHTNVIMSIGENFAVLCREAVASKEKCEEIESRLRASGKRVVNISYSQMLRFAGNVLEVKNLLGKPCLLMSDTAKASLSHEQLDAIAGQDKVIAAHIPHIEEVGGGSVRCMLAEVVSERLSNLPAPLGRK